MMQTRRLRGYVRTPSVRTNARGPGLQNSVPEAPVARVAPISTAKTVMRPVPAPQGIIRRFTRGKEHPRGIVWFGATSFWGHMRHFFASALATQNIDSRDWMTPDEPQELAGPHRRAAGRRSSRVEPDRSARPRSLHRFRRGHGRRRVRQSRGGASHICAVRAAGSGPARRVSCRPARRDPPVRRRHGVSRRDGAGIDESRHQRPGIKCCKRCRTMGDAASSSASLATTTGTTASTASAGMFRRPSPGMTARASARSISPKMLEYYAQWAREFVRGDAIDKPAALAFSGYTAVQNASYFALPLAPAIEMLGVDRQLTTTDSRQGEFLGDYYRARPGFSHARSASRSRCTTSAIRARRARRWSRACNSIW